MSKYRSPFSSNELWISQTYHTTGSNKAVDFGNAPVGTPVYAVADGTIGTISSAYGSYLTLDVANSDHKLFYVHIYNWKVSKGQSLKKGQLLAEIAPQSVNGNYPPHLHLGLQTQYSLMDYMDRNITFRTKYQAIKDVWFTGDSFNWSKHKDLSYTVSSFLKGDMVQFTGVQNIRTGSGTEYKVQRSSMVGEVAKIIDGPRIADGYVWWDMAFNAGGTGWVAEVNKFKKYVKPVTPPEPPGQTGCEKQVESLKEEILALESITETLEAEKEVLITQNVELYGDISSLEAELLESRVELGDLQKKFELLQINFNRVAREKNEAIAKLKECGAGESQGASLKLFIVELLQKLGLIKK